MSDLQGYRVWYREQCSESRPCSTCRPCSTYRWKQGLVIERHPLVTAILMNCNNRYSAQSELLIHHDQNLITKLGVLGDERFSDELRYMREEYIGKNENDLPPLSVELTEDHRVKRTGKPYGWSRTSIFGNPEY